MNKLMRGFLKVVMTRTMYCIHVEKKHDMEYRSTIIDNMRFGGPRRVHVNVCENCKRVTFIDA